MALFSSNLVIFVPQRITSRLFSSHLAGPVPKKEMHSCRTYAQVYDMDNFNVNTQNAKNFPCIFSLNPLALAVTLKIAAYYAPTPQTLLKKEVLFID
jgi:hypothetical protein